MRNRIVLLAALSVGPASGPAVAQTPGAASQERQDILTYQLTLPRANQLVTAMQAMTQYVVSLPDFRDRVVKSMKMTPAERPADAEKDPKAMAILKQNGLTAQEYPVGAPALCMALMAAQGTASSSNAVASSAM